MAKSKGKLRVSAKMAAGRKVTGKTPHPEAAAAAEPARTPVQLDADEAVVGIDLGTTTSCVATLESDSPTVIPIRGHLTTPSIVAVNEKGQRISGHAAKRQAVTNAANTLLAMKRLIGRKWESDEVKRTRMACPVTLVEGPQGDVRVELGGAIFSLPELSAMLLQDLKLGAEEHLGKKIGRAVITVPAYFNDNQRQATKDAGTIAGLEVMRIINEPTAAAIAYGYGRAVDKTIVVFDLGGGTFDISIVKVRAGGDFEVLGTGGDTFLGGEDFDRAIVDFLAKKFKDLHGVDLRSERVPVQRLKEAAERVKIELSAAESAEINLPALYTPPSPGSAPINMALRMTRAELDSITLELVTKTIEHCKRALASAKMSLAQVDDVLLVGGATRVPAVHEAVSKYFGRRPSQAVHPDEAVALGAAVHAGWLAGQTKREVHLYDVTPLALGIRMTQNRMRTLIEANSRVPAMNAMTATTSRDDQTSVRFVVLQGQSDNADMNEVLGEFELKGLRAKRAMTLPIEVEFAIDDDGIVRVTARDRDTDQVRALTVTASSCLTKEEIVTMAADAKDYMSEQIAQAEVKRAVQAVETAVSELAKTAAAADKRFKEGDYRRDALEKANLAIERAREAITTGDPSELEDCAAELGRRQGALKALLSR